MGWRLRREGGRTRRVLEPAEVRLDYCTHPQARRMGAVMAARAPGSQELPCFKRLPSGRPPGHTAAAGLAGLVVWPNFNKLLARWSQHANLIAAQLSMRVCGGARLRNVTRWAFSVAVRTRRTDRCAESASGSMLTPRHSSPGVVALDAELTGSGAPAAQTSEDNARASRRCLF
jgi:hypothetical protein